MGRLLKAAIAVAAQIGHQHDVFGFQDRIALQLAAPMTVGLLQIQQMLARPFDGLLKRLQKCVSIMSWHAATGPPNRRLCHGRLGKR